VLFKIRRFFRTIVIYFHIISTAVGHRRIRERRATRYEIDDILIYEAKMEIPRRDTGGSRPARLPDAFIP